MNSTPNEARYTLHLKPKQEHKSKTTQENEQPWRKTKQPGEKEGTTVVAGKYTGVVV